MYFQHIFIPVGLLQILSLLVPACVVYLAVLVSSGGLPRTISKSTRFVLLHDHDWQNLYTPSTVFYFVFSFGDHNTSKLVQFEVQFEDIKSILLFMYIYTVVL